MGKQTKRKVSLVEKKRSKQGEKKMRKADIKRERGEREKREIFLCFDSRSSAVQEEKLIHASQVMCKYQNLGVSSNSTR